MAKRKIAPSRTVDRPPVDQGLVDFLEILKDNEIKDALGFVCDFYQRARDWRTPWHDKWVDYYQIYRMYSPYYKNRPQWQTSLYVPMGFEIIEIFMPPMIEALLSTNPMMRAISDSIIHKPYEKAVETLLDTRVWQTRYFMELYQTLKEMLIYGTAFQKLEYEMGREYEGPALRARDIFDIYPEKNSKDIETSSGILDRDMRHYEYIKMMERVGAYKNIEKIGRDDGRNRFSHLDRLRSIGLSNSNGQDETTDYHEIFDYWGKYYVEDTEEFFDVVITVVDRTHIVRFQETPYMLKDDENEFWYAIKPYVKFLDVPNPHEFYGIGEIEVIRDIQYEANDRKNAIGDAIQYSLSPVYQLLTGAVSPKDEHKIVFAPGHIVKMNKVDGLKPLHSSTDWVLGYNDIEALKQDARDGTGSQLAMQGKEGNIRKTANEAIILSDNSSKRTKMKIMIVNITGVSDGAEKMIAMDMQYTDQKVMGKIFGINGVNGYMEITPTDLKWRGKFRMEPASMYGSKAIRTQQLMQFIQTVTAIPGYEQGLKLTELLKRTAESMDIDPNNLIITMEPLQVQAAGGGMSGLLAPGMGGVQGASPEMAGLQPSIPISEGENANLEKALQYLA